MAKPNTLRSTNTAVICETDYVCGDGCCSEQYVEVTINDRLIDQKFVALHPSELGDMFTKMGYNVAYERRSLDCRISDPLEK